MVDYEEVHQAVQTFLSTFRSKMPAETIQLVTNIYTKHSLEKKGQLGMLKVGPTMPSLKMVLRLIQNMSWANTYAIQNFGPSKDSDPAQVNGFCVDDINDKNTMSLRRIFVNETNGTVGTVIHEFLHFCTSIEFSEASAPHKLLYEGPTEYFTRQAQPLVDRSAHYPAEHHTISKLIQDGKLAEDTLAKAYFEGSSTAVTETVAAITKSGGKIYSEIFDHVFKATGHQL